jgi:hypothetical protein
MSRFGQLSRVEFLLGAGALLTACGGGAVIPGTRATPSFELLNGNWALKSTSGQSILSLRFRPGNQVYGSQFVLSQGTTATPAISAGGSDSFRVQSINPEYDGASTSHISRDAGEFNVMGFDGTRTSGDVVFVPRTSFAASVTATSLSSRQLLQLSLTGASVQDVELILGAFADADVVTVALLSQSIQDAQSALTLKQLLPSLTASDLKVSLALNVTPAYVRDLQRSGLRDLAPADVINLRQSNVDGEYVRSQTLNGIVPSASQLLQSKGVLQQRDAV